MPATLDHQTEFISHSDGTSQNRLASVAAMSLAVRLEACSQPVRTDSLIESEGDEASSAPADNRGISNLATSATTAASLAMAIFLIVAASWSTWQLVAMFLQRVSHYSQLELMRALAGV